jgi:hypothetical protein
MGRPGLACCWGRRELLEGIAGKSGVRAITVPMGFRLSTLPAGIQIWPGSMRHTIIGFWVGRELGEPLGTVKGIK